MNRKLSYNGKTLKEMTTEEIWKNIGIIYGMFILVYGIYFIATDVQFSRNIEEGR